MHIDRCHNKYSYVRLFFGHKFKTPFERKTNHPDSKHGQNYSFAASLALRRSPFDDRLDGCLAFFRQLIIACLRSSLVDDDYHRHCSQHYFIADTQPQGVKKSCNRELY